MGFEKVIFKNDNAYFCKNKKYTLILVLSLTRGSGNQPSTTRTSLSNHRFMERRVERLWARCSVLHKSSRKTAAVVSDAKVL